MGCDNWDTKFGVQKQFKGIFCRVGICFDQEKSVWGWFLLWMSDVFGELALHGVDQIIHGPDTEHRIHITTWGSSELDLLFLAHIPLQLWDSCSSNKSLDQDDLWCGFYWEDGVLIFQSVNRSKKKFCRVALVVGTKYENSMGWDYERYWVFNVVSSTRDGAQH